MNVKKYQPGSIGQLSVGVRGRKRILQVSLRQQKPVLSNLYTTEIYNLYVCYKIVLHLLKKGNLGEINVCPHIQRKEDNDWSVHCSYLQNMLIFIVLKTFQVSPFMWKSISQHGIYFSIKQGCTSMTCTRHKWLCSDLYSLVLLHGLFIPGSSISRYQTTGTAKHR